MQVEVFNEGISREKRYKDYLLKRYSISREGYWWKILTGKFTGFDRRKKGGILFRRWCDRFKDWRFEVCSDVHYDIWDSIHQLRLKDGDPNT